MRTAQITRNAAMVVVQILVSAASLFILYRFLVRAIGIEAVGVWSVVTSLTSIVYLADPGIVGGTARFVARARAQADGPHPGAYIQTGVVSVGVIYLVLAFLAYPIVDRIVAVLVPADRIAEARLILPYALVVLWLMNVAAVLQGAVDGTDRADLRAGLLIVGTSVQLISAILLVSRIGLLGLVYAQGLQALTLVIGSWLVLRRCLAGLPILPIRWHRSLFRELIGFGAQLQIVNVAVMLTDPVTKALLSRFGGLASVGYYDVGNRLIQLARSTVVNATQVVVPAIAHLHERAAAQVATLYRESYRMVVYVSLPMLGALIASMPIVSEWCLQRYEFTFVMYADLLAFGWFINVLSAPAYFAGVGTGDLRWNVLGHVLTGLVNVILGPTLGLLLGGLGVVIGAVTAVTAGSMFVLVKYHGLQGGRLPDLLPRENASLLGWSLVAIVASLATYYSLRPHFSLVPLTLVVLTLLMGLMGLQAWRHPARRTLTDWASRPTAGT